MKNKKISGPAVFMYSTILLTVAISAVCFVLYYGGIARHGAVLWTGIVTFMILYHFGLRIFMGEITKLFKVDYNHPWYKQRKFEPHLYKLLRVRRWKDKVLTFDPQSFDFKNRTLHQLATTMAKSELDHWINEIISLSSVLFCLLWGYGWLFLLTSVLAMAFDAQFIIVQRYNRPIVLKLKKMRENKSKKQMIGEAL